MQNIAPCLWFDGQAQQAASFYVSVFRHARITATSYYGEGAPGQPGSVMTVSFVLDGQEFLALNGGPHFKFTPAVSFIAYCDTQADVDHYWDKLCEGGAPNQCGWLTDRFGVSWQVVPRMLPALFSGTDKAAAQRAMNAMLKMVKLDIAALQRAFDGG